MQSNVDFINERDIHGRRNLINPRRHINHDCYKYQGFFLNLRSPAQYHVQFKWIYYMFICNELLFLLSNVSFSGFIAIEQIFTYVMMD